MSALLCVLCGYQDRALNITAETLRTQRKRGEVVEGVI
jgi:hypothetical protein